MLAATLDAETEGTDCRFTLTVENTGDEEVTLSFRNGQRAEFVASADGDEVWRWSQGQMFTQVLSAETVEPGQRVTYEGIWENPASGTYDCRGEVAADVDVAAETTVSV